MMVRSKSKLVRTSTGVFLGSALAYATIVGCGKPADQATSTAVSESSSASAAVPRQARETQSIANPSQHPSGIESKIKFKTADGDTAFSIKPQQDGAKLVDGSEKELARFNLDGNKLKIKDADDVVLGYVVASEGQLKIKDTQQAVLLWELQRQEDGDWKLKDGKETLVYKVKARDYGFEIEDANERSLFKVKLKDGKTSLRNATENTVYSTHDSIPTIAVASLGFEEIDELAVRSALMTMLTIRQGH